MFCIVYVHRFFFLIGLYGPLFRPLVENKGLPYFGKAMGVFGPSLWRRYLGCRLCMVTLDLCLCFGQLKLGTDGGRLFLVILPKSYLACLPVLRL